MPELTETGTLREGQRIGARRRAPTLRRLAKLTFGGSLVALGGLMLYQQLAVTVSTHAAINARIAVIRAPIDGFATATLGAPGTMVRASAVVGHIDNPLADFSRVADLERRLTTSQLDRRALEARLADLERARAEAAANAGAYRAGRVREDEMLVAQVRANLAAALARADDSAAAARRGALLQARGFQSDAAEEHLRDTAAADRQSALAAKQQLAAQMVELDAARHGVFLGDSYNDAPYSLQQARELKLRITETRTALDSAARSIAALTAQLAAERKRFLANGSAVLTAPVAGRLWLAQAISGEYVSKGQDLFSIIDCATTVVTATASQRDYNELQLGEPARFRVAGTDRSYSAHVVSLGATAADGVYAIAPAHGDRQIVAVVPRLAANREDGCAVGRSGELIFAGSGHALGSRLARALSRLLGFS
jgi:multidrug resistance efflux pump